MSPATNPVSVGLVGLGNIASHHAERITDLGHRVAAGADISPESCARFTEAHGAETYEDYAEMYEREDLDAVVICTPNKFHEASAVAALDAGLNVLIEKPLAHTIESAQRIADAAARSDGFCMVGFHNRFASSVEVLKELQQNGRLGETRHIEANFIRRRGIPGRGSWFTSKEVAGGGAVIDIGVHAIDLAMHLHDFPTVTEVSATVRSQFGSRDDYACLDMWGEDSGPEGFDVGDSASVFIRLADGKTISLEVAWATNRPSNEEFFVRGSEAGAKFEMGDGALTLYESGTAGTDHLADTEIETNTSDTHQSEQELFLNAVREGKPPERNTVEQALSVQRIIDGIYRSSEMNRAVSLTDTPVKTPQTEADPVENPNAD